MDNSTLQTILGNIRYKPEFSFRSKWDGLGSDNWIQVILVDDGEIHHCRKWRISKHMTESEIVQTAFLAIRTAEEHETREKFQYKGSAIFQPHRNVNDLISTADSFDVRI